MTLTPHQVRDIAAGTAGVTAGPWFAVEHRTDRVQLVVKGADVEIVLARGNKGRRRDTERANAAHIARLSPEIVSELCAGWLRDNERQGAPVKSLFTYQRTFNAIAAAVSLNAVGIGISVLAFIEAFGPTEAPSLTAAHAAGEREDDRRRMDRLSDPGQQGRATARDNAALAENPYLTDTPAWWAWLEGYRSERDAMTACALVPNGEEDGR